VRRRALGLKEHTAGEWLFLQEREAEANKLEAERKVQELAQANADIARRETLRIRRNANYDQSPPNKYTTNPPGIRAYKFQDFAKGADGNWYARYQSVSGSKQRLYSLSEQKHMPNDVTMKDAVCTNCRVLTQNALTNYITNTCPNGHEFKLGFYN
jgi:hypothetical protein